MTAATPARVAEILTLLRTGRQTLSADELAAAVGIGRRKVVDALAVLTGAKLVIAGEPEMVQRVPKRAPVALWRYYAAADETWPDWLPQSQEGPPQPCHGPIGKPWLRGVPASVWQLGSAA